MQVANILLARAHLVPVGVDQLPHVELAREMARRFNRDFKPIFPEPEALVGRTPRLLGTDGNAKMSKSRGSTIDLRDSADVVAKRCASCTLGRLAAQTSREKSRRIGPSVTSMPSTTTLPR